MTIEPDNQSAAATPSGWPPWDGKTGGASGGPSGGGGGDEPPWSKAKAQFQGYCRTCRYPLRGLDSRRCPECGRAFDPGDPRTYFATLQISRKAIGALVLAIVAAPTAIIVVGALFWIGARIMAKQALDEIDRAEGSIPGRGLAQAAAIICNIVLAAVLVVVVGWILVAILTPSSHGAGGRMKNSTQVRGVVSALTLWSASQTSTDDFPKVGLLQNAPASNSTIDRFKSLCNVTGGDSLSVKLLVNPAGTDVPAANSTNLLSTNISYALLDAGNPEWKNLTNAQAPLVCDKQVGKGSFYNNNKWEGNVGWGDVHVDYWQSPSVPTVMGGVTYPQDDLWKQSTTNDALMIDP